MHYLSPYPSTPAARDRFIVDLRGPRPSHDPWRFQSLALEDELTERGNIARVGTVFLTGPECRWRCAMCDLWRSTTRGNTPDGAIPVQLRAARQEWRTRVETVSRIKLYNASNFFDPHAVPEVDYPSIASELDDLDQVIVESHPSLVGARVERFQSSLRGPSLEVAMGLETVHPTALEALNKRMTSDDFARACEWLRARSISIRVFLLIHPPFIAHDEQDEWLVRSVEFAAACGASVISLVPTRGGNGTMEALTREGLFRAPTSSDVSRSYHLVSRQSSVSSHQSSVVSRQSSVVSRQSSVSSHQSVRILVDPWSFDAR